MYSVYIDTNKFEKKKIEQKNPKKILTNSKRGVKLRFRQIGAQTSDLMILMLDVSHGTITSIENKLGRRQKWKSFNVLIAFVFSEVKDNVDGNGENQNANTNTLTNAHTHTRAKQRGKPMISYRACKMLNGTFISNFDFAHLK